METLERRGRTATHRRRRARLGRGRQSAGEVRARCSSRRRAAGCVAVAHAGEEGPPAYIGEALDVLQVRAHRPRRALPRGPRAGAAPGERAGPAHRVPALQPRAAGDRRTSRSTRSSGCWTPALLVTVNSDDPAYFGGYLAGQLRGRAAGAGPEPDDLAQLARNSITASLLPDAAQGRTARGDRPGGAPEPEAARPPRALRRSPRRRPPGCGR